MMECRFAVFRVGWERDWEAAGASASQLRHLRIAAWSSYPIAFALAGVTLPFSSIAVGQ